MRDIANNLDLAQLQNGRKGFISNARNDGVKLHKAGCEAVGAMVSTAYPKKHFETFDEAKTWLDKTYSSRWYSCGLCNPWIPTADRAE